MTARCTVINFAMEKYGDRWNNRTSDTISNNNGHQNYQNGIRISYCGHNNYNRKNWNGAGANDGVERYNLQNLEIMKIIIKGK